MNKKRIIVTVAAVGVFGILGGVGGYLYLGRNIESTDNAYVKADVSTVAAQVQGLARKIIVADNQKVRAGDVLIEIEDTDYRAKVAQLRNMVLEREAQLLNLRDQENQQQARVRQAQADATAARADVERSNLDAARFTKLLQEEYTTRQRYESAIADQRRYAATLQNKLATIDTQALGLPVLASQRHSAEAEIEQAKAQLALAELDLQRTVVLAPIDGIVANRGVRVGDLVRPGVTLLSLVPDGKVYVTANYKETQLKRMAVGQTAEVKVDALSAAPITGRVESLSPGSGSEFSVLPLDNATGNFTKITQRVPVRIALRASPELLVRLRPGLSVEVAVDTGSARAANSSVGAADSTSATMSR